MTVLPRGKVRKVSIAVFVFCCRRVCRVRAPGDRLGDPERRSLALGSIARERASGCLERLIWSVAFVLFDLL